MNEPTLNPNSNSPTTEQHRRESPKQLRVAIVTVSDTRTLENDLGGKLIQDLLESNHHAISSRQIVADDRDQLRQAIIGLLATDCQAILVTGSTGLSERDIAPEAIEPLLETPIPGFGEIFRMLSFEEIGPASMLSRAFAGKANRKILIAMPGSPAGVRLAMERLVIPELPHLVHHALK